MTDDSQYFSPTYAEARRRFIATSGILAAETDKFQVPAQADRDLFVDVAYLPATLKKKTLIALSSGVHGMEASAGSAIQLMFLNELLPTIDRSEVGIYLVHCLNPYGFKHGRRTTEANVNLNRNFATHPELFQTPNDGYEKLAHWFESKRPVKAPLLPLVSTVKLLLESRQLGFTDARMVQAIGQGQFKHPKGIEYGGTGYEPQVQYFIDGFKTVAADYDDILFFDLHTGLGEKGRLHILSGSTPESRDRTLLNKLFRSDEDQSLYAITNDDEPGFYRTIGDINTLIPVLAPGKRVLALTFEFATLGASIAARLDMLERIRLENLGYHSGYSDSVSAEKIRRKFAELFAPKDPAWQRNVIKLARGTLTNVLRRL